MPTYSSIADLIFNNNRQPFTTALVLGAVSVGDGGGGIFVWHPTSTATANGETVIDVPNLAVGRWLLIISNSASPTKDKGDLIVNNGVGLARFPLSGVNDRVLTEDSEQPLGVKWAAVSGGSGAPNIQTFSSDGIWTKPAGKTLALIEIWGAGGGGGSGARRDSQSSGCGGGSGGGGGGKRAFTLPLSQLPATFQIITGVGGDGGAAQTVNDTNGNDGTDGQETLIQFPVTFLTFARATGGAKGLGGINAGTQPAGGDGGGDVMPGGNGGRGNFTGVDEAQLGGIGYGGAGGGGGGGGMLAGVPFDAGEGGGYAAEFNANAGTPIGGVAKDTDGALFEGGGGGSATVAVGNAGKTSTAGGGGGGGAGADNGFNSGAGGRGGGGYVQITCV